MIRQSLSQTKRATYSILVPDPNHARMPSPNGTGFFVDKSGLFLTAHHVVKGTTVPEIWLLQSHAAGEPVPTLRWPETVQVWPDHDIALLKLDFERNATAAHLSELNDFPYITIDFDTQEDGTPVYSFGYPLPVVENQQLPNGLMIGHTGLAPRTTSAIIASNIEHTKMLQTGADSRVYILDKALNYGNSGGPIINAETGKVFAVCSRFQPVEIRQPNRSVVVIPSLYGIVTSIANIRDALEKELQY